MWLLKKNKNLVNISSDSNQPSEANNSQKLNNKNHYRKINIFYADDISENVRNLLDGIQQAGLVSKTKEKDNAFKLNLPDKDDHYKHNRSILKSDDCLIDLDYSTKIEDSLEKIRKSEHGFDLIIADLYFGDNDQDFRDSKVGGIWIMYWAMHLSKDRKAICKLYSGQLETVVAHIDFKKAKEFLEEAYNIKIEEIEKSKDARSWREYLQAHLEQVRKNILSEIEMDNRIDFINYLTSNLRREHFNNLIIDNKFAEFKKRLIELGNIEFNMTNGQKMKIVNLFPMELGNHYISSDRKNFQNMSADTLERTLYTDELTFNSWEKRDLETKRFEFDNVKIEEFRNHDAAGRPVYGIKIIDRDYDMGLISQIESSFINSLDYTYQIHKFFANQRGFRFWSTSSPASKIGTVEFDNIRKNYILPFFNKIRHCFDNPIPLDKKDGISLADQLVVAISSIKENYFWEKGVEEQTLEHKFLKLEKNSLFDPATKKTLLPLKDLFKINVNEFFKTTLQLKEGTNYSDYEGDEFIRIKTSKFYWYCNAYLVRLGLKDIKNNMISKKPIYYLLESRDQEKKALIKYKIIIRDDDNGLPSIARQFQPKEEKVYKFDEYLKGFCQIVIRSKVKSFNGISYNVYTSKKDVPCSQIKETGTEFEITFTQGRER